MSNNPLREWDDATVIAQTRHWVEQTVIGLNLCPFANAVFRKNQIDFRVSHALDEAALLRDLAAAAEALVAAPAEQIDTSLLIHPGVLHDFFDFNDFIGVAEDWLEDAGLSGVLQIASFHPHYQFAGVAADDITHYTNRSPFPTLHLLREESLDKAIDAYPDTEQIVERNLDTLRQLGLAGWQARQPADDKPTPA